MSARRPAILGKGWARRAALALLSVLVLTGLTACTADTASREVDSDGLRPFQSEDELADYLSDVRERLRDDIVLYDVAESDVAMGELSVAPDEEPPPPMNDSAAGITNNQTEGVDEGGIVKAVDDMLVVLKRGRLFTISTAGGRLRAIDSINAFPPGTDGSQSWYDELLVAEDRVIVIGYSYDRGGTEVNRFHLSGNGELRFEDAHHLSSADYYSADNYASRLIGNELIFYAPLELHYRDDPLEALPGARRWQGGGTESAFGRIAGPEDIFIAEDLFRDDEATPSTLHSVTRCDVTSDDFDCSATGVIAGWSREFYVARDAVYLWIDDGNPFGSTQGDDGNKAHIYRLPLNGGRPAAIGARGMPIDQFSFLERDDRLNILVAGTGLSPRIEEPRYSHGTLSLIQLPLSDFGDGSGDVAEGDYRHFDAAAADFYEMENRYVGEHIVFGYGGRRDYGDHTPARIFVASLAGGAATQVSLDFGVERIERLGADAVVIGSDAEGRLGFSAIDVGAQPALADVFVLPAAAQGESRSHAYFYLPDSDSADGASGLLGLPIAKAVEPRFRRLLGNAAAMLFLRREDRRFSLAGTLNADVERVVDDACQASCVDWYGNARPIFLGDRIFALLGYELVEGRMAGGMIAEIARINFAPPPPDPESPAE